MMRRMTAPVGTTSMRDAGPRSDARPRQRRLALGMALCGALLLAVGPARADTLVAYQSLLNGAQEAPAASSPSQGLAFVTYNKTSKMLCYSLSFSPLAGTELAAHIHGPAQPGPCTTEACNGAVLFDVTGGSGPSPVGNPKVGCVGPLTKGDLKNLNKGLLYVNIHTTAFPLGEIRGQIYPIAGLQYKKAAPISGAITSPSPSGAFLDDAGGLLD